MINFVIRLAMLGVDLFTPTEVALGRSALQLYRRGSIVERAAARRLKVRKKMGILDAATSGIRKGASLSTEVAPATAPMRILPPHPYEPLTQPNFPSPVSPDRINVPPNAYPTTPLSPEYTPERREQGSKQSNPQNTSRLTPQPTQETQTDRDLNKYLIADTLANAMSSARGLADRWLPGIEWQGTVSAIGFKTTPTRTVVHYALAVAFGLVKQQRVSSVALSVDIDYESNHVTVSYVSKAWWLTEMITLGLYNRAGAILPPALAKDVTQIETQARDALSRSLVMGITGSPFKGIVDLGKEGVKLAGDAMKTVIKAYSNLGRLLGPLAVYDMGDETIFGGRSSLLLRAPDQPEPFKSMQSDKNGNPVPLLTRLPAPNPQPPVSLGDDPSTGYSLDLRSLVAQALHDPGIAPPIPDTNVSLPTIYRV